MSKDRFFSIITFVFSLGTFALAYLFTGIFGNDLYLFEWTARHFYCFLWIAVLILLLFKRRIIAILVSTGNLVGIIGGQFVGDWIMNINMAKITDGMSAEQIYQLSKHPGVLIWLLMFIIFTILGCVLCFFRDKNQQNKAF